MSLEDLLNGSYVYWMNIPADPRDIAISCRVRLARNITAIPFPHLLDPAQGTEIMEKVKAARQGAQGSILGSMHLLTFDQLDILDRQTLTEKHLCSPEHAASGDAYRGIMLNQDGSLAVMINEEDHLRIQCLLPGLNLKECHGLAQQLDDELEQTLDYAFDEARGYLTACPTNVGTGMRASAMLHLPAAQMTGTIKLLLQNVSQLGLAVRGLYGEGSEPVGNLYQISNQITLGQAEEDICNYLQTIAEQIVEQETLLRERLMADMPYQLEDKIGRAYGILSNARLIGSDEALRMLSMVRLGVDLQIIKGISIFTLNQLMVAIRSAHLQKIGGHPMEAMQRDVLRAEVIKQRLSGKEAD
ncbi:MAG: protein arginine kinase [Syntrophomonadaceae bacterium]